MPSFPFLAGEDPAGYAALLADYAALHRPACAAERYCVERVVQVAWRARRLDALEARVLADLLDDGTREPEARPARALPSLAILIRFRARLARDHEEALAELGRLRALREEEPVEGVAPAPIGTREPERHPAAPASRPMCRAERRRLAALDRRHRMPAAA